MSYDAFISYSHAADGLLAPRLQAGLQRFAKPWWKRRAIRVFRDESSLSANPHLWSSITDALDASTWFVLLLSPEAAKSEWVNQEIEYWLANKPANRILPVVTDGEFVWNGQGPLSPAALAGAFSEEPRWVDLRFARTEAQIDLKNPTFLAAVADVASAVRGVAKDDLEGEEVKQHRRTIRTAWAAGVAVAVLAVAATAFGINAASERRIAQEERDRANNLSQQEADARVRADEATAEAEAAAEDAKAAAGAEAEARTEAEAVALAASGRAVVRLDPDLGLLLALESHARDPGNRPAVDTIRESLAEHRIEATAFWPEGLGFATSVFVAVSPDGRRVAATADGSFVQVYDALTLQPIASLGTARMASNLNGVARPSFDPTGTLIAATDADGITRVWDVASGSEVFQVESGPISRAMPAVGPGSAYFSSDGAHIVTTRLRGGFSGGVLSTIDLSTGEIFEEPGNAFYDVAFGADPSQFALANFFCCPETVGLFDPDLETHPTRWFQRLEQQTLGVAWSRDGRLVASAHWDGVARIWDADSGEPLASFVASPDPISDLAFNDDGTLLAVGGSDGTVGVWGVDSMRNIAMLRGHQGAVWSVAFAAEGTRVISAASDRTVRSWNLASDGIREVVTVGVGEGMRVTGIDTDVAGTLVAVLTRAGARTQGPLLVLDVTTGTTIRALTDQFGYGVSFSFDGSAVLSQPGYVQGPTVPPFMSPVTATDVETGAALVQVEGMCSELGVDGCDQVGSDPYWEFTNTIAQSPDGELLVVGGLSEVLAVFDASTGTRIHLLTDFDGSIHDAQFSPDGALLAVSSAGSIRFLETDGFHTIAELEPDGFVPRISWSPDGRLVALASQSGRIQVIDVQSARQIETIEAHFGGLMDVDFSPNGQLLVSAGGDGTAKVWNVSDWTLAETLVGHVGGLTGASFATDGLVVTGSFDGTVRVFTLAPDRLVSIARERVTRTFTNRECADFEIDPCPTLDEIRAGA